MVHLLEPPESCRFHLHHTRVIAHDLAMTWPMVSHGIPLSRSRENINELNMDDTMVHWYLNIVKYHPYGI
jgi:hypothetical protein